LGNPNKFIHALISCFSRCKDQGIYPEDFLEYSENLKTNLTDLPEEDDKERIKEVAEAYHIYQQLLLENGFLDFGDLINYCVKLFQERPLILKKYRNKFKYILIDEFQDTNLSQYKLVKILAEPKNNLTVCADDDQCLPGDSKIEIFENGKIKTKKIEDIKKSDKILTAVGKGHIGIANVDKVFISEKEARILTIKTENGCSIDTTDNHKMFCCVPRIARQGYHYVYLMFRKNLGWRIGITDDLILRLRLERLANKILVLKAFNSKTEARYYETLWSLKYGIPTACFKKKERTVMKDSLLAKLYKEIDVENNIKKLAQDLNVDLGSPHYCLDAIRQGNSTRIIINLQMCYRKYRSKEYVKNKIPLFINNWINHRLYIETSDEETIKKLKIAGYDLKKAKKGMRLNMESADLKKLEKEARIIEKITGGFVEYKFNAAIKYSKPSSDVRNHMALIMPAKNLVLGHYLPIKKGNEIIYDKIISIKATKKKIKVYDLEIKKTHNFIANGVVVHNSIYRWRGASYNNILQFKKDFPKAKEVFLIRNYRSPQDILDLSYKFIKANDPDRLEYISKINKKLISEKKGKGIIEHLHFRSAEEEVEGVIRKIGDILKKNKDVNFNDFAILIRANNQAPPFIRALERANFPYQFLASRGLYFKPIILDIISFLKLLDNYHESSAAYRVLNFPFFKISSEDIMKITQYSGKKAKSIYEALQEIFLIRGISSKTADRANFILSLIKKHTEMTKDKSISEIFISFLEDSGYLKYLTAKDSKLELDLVLQFYNKIKEFEESAPDPTLKNFMEHLNMELEAGEEGKLEFDPQQGPDIIRIMTVHSAKGLEFRYVFLVNMVDKRFPSIERKDPIEIPRSLIKEIIPEGDVHLQEERRLFYVAMTRAKEGLFLTSSEDYGGKTKKKPSRFITELGMEKEAGVESFRTNEIVLEKKSIDKKEKGKMILPDYFSFSQLAAFQKCPLQYKFAHILKVPIRGKAVFSFGKSMHNTLYKFLKLGEENKAFSQKNLFGFSEKKKNPADKNFLELKDLLKIYEKEWIEEWYENKKQKQEYYDLGKKLLKNFYAQYVKNPPEILKVNGSEALELPFVLKIGKDSLKGKIDRIDREGEKINIIDYKTGEAKEKLSSEDKLQLAIYQIAMQEIFKIKIDKLTYYYLNEGRGISFVLNEKEIAKQKQIILEIIEQIKKSDFAPTPGWQCQFCDFRYICEYSSSPKAD